MPLNIVFMGTPEFAVPCLGRILEDGHAVRSVFSQPDKPRGRGMSTQPPPVKWFAQERGIPVHQPSGLRDGQALELLREEAPDLIVVVAYGRILPKEILRLPPLGCVNVHASLLPRLRGAAPIQWSVLNGDEVTGVTTMFMAEGLDTGDIILQRETEIGGEETSGELFGRLSVLGADCLSETIALLEAGKAPRIPQDDALATYAPMIDKSLAAVDFKRTAREVCNQVRGMHPAPCAFTRFGGRLLKLHKAVEAAGYEGYDGEPGVLLERRRLIVGCAGGAVELRRVQPEGKKEMDAAAFICGCRPAGGEKFTVD